MPKPRVRTFRLGNADVLCWPDGSASIVVCVGGKVGVFDLVPSFEFSGPALAAWLDRELGREVEPAKETADA